MDEPVMVRCPGCDCCFYVVWARNPMYPGPEYCPFCGDEIDYAELWREQHQENDDK